ncbi:hypothetical protein ABKV19_007766, partial [Rosa sericea]
AELNRWNMYSSLNKSHGALPWTSRNDMTLRSAMVVELPIFLNDKRLLSTQVKAPAQARQMGALRVSMTSPGLIYEPYAPREKVPFFQELSPHSRGISCQEKEALTDEARFWGAFGLYATINV